MPSMFKKYARIPDRFDEFSRGHPRGLVIADANNQGIMTMGFSYCSKRDQFDRKIAHELANQRFDSGEFTCNLFDPDSIEAMVDKAFEHLPVQSLDAFMDCVMFQAAEYLGNRFDMNHELKSVQLFE